MHFHIVRRPLDPVISRSIVGVAVPVVFTVGFVVLLVVGHEIVERKTIMGSDEVHARPGLPSPSVEEIGRALIRAANSAIFPSSPFQYALTVSR